MKLSEAAKLLNAKLYVNSGDPEILSVYAGDFLSRVISKAPSGCIWLTIMTNVNVAGVMSIADISAVVLCENTVPDEALLLRAQTESFNILGTALSAYESCVCLAALAK